MKKHGKLIAAFLGGAVFLTSLTALAADDGETGDIRQPPGYGRAMEPGHGRGYRMGPRRDAEGMAERAAELFDVDKDELLEYVEKNHTDFRDIFRGAMLSKVSGRTFADIMAMREGGETWRGIESNLGISREDIRAAMGAVMAEHITGADNNLTKDEVISLIKEGYHPRDIRMAGILGKSAGKSASEVLSIKKVNNTWEDVAEELGLDESVVREAFRRRDDFPRNEGGEGYHNGRRPPMMRDDRPM